MNYGKTAYLKILDIEKAINFNNKNSSKNIYFEITKPNINENFNFLTPYTTTLNDFIPTKNEDVFFQIKVNLTPTILSDINFEILINDNIIHSETKSISSNQTEILLMKTYTPLSDDKLSLKLKISTN